MSACIFPGKVMRQTPTTAGAGWWQSCLGTKVTVSRPKGERDDLLRWMSLALWQRDYLVGSRELFEICAFEWQEGFVWFSSWLDIFSLFTRAGLRFVSSFLSLPSAGNTSGSHHT